MKGNRKTFVGFGFGPIQSGLFLYEAVMSGNFDRFVIAEVDEDAVEAVNSNGGRYVVNIARPNRIDGSAVNGVEMYNPADPSGRGKILEAVIESDEMAVCLPSVDFYDAGGTTSVSGIIVKALALKADDAPAVIYAAENNNRAAEILHESIAAHSDGIFPGCVRTLNTVIGKMSGIVDSSREIRRLGLNPMTPGMCRAILVEEFNRILVSRIDLRGYNRGIEVFSEKEDLLPFEEAKLYGHNAVHAVIGYLADFEGLARIADAGLHSEIVKIAYRVFLRESGPALIRRHGHTGDPLFTEDGYRLYAEDLIERMINPNLNDLTSRICRDHVRKLGYSDRLYGTMRLALDCGIEPVNLALGTAACIMSMQKSAGKGKKVSRDNAVCDSLAAGSIEDLLMSVWKDEADHHAEKLIDMTVESYRLLKSSGLITD